MSELELENSDFRPGEEISITVGGNSVNVRLDNYLCSRFGQLSRAKIQRIIKTQNIMVNGQRSKASRKLNFGDVIELVLPSRELTVDHVPLDIIYEDSDLIALNKQPGIIVHPARGTENKSGTLINGLLYYASQKPEEQRFIPDVIHRLDRNTTGVIIFSKSARANQLISEQFENRNTKKEYLALVHGILSEKTALIDEPIGQHPRYFEKYAVTQDGKTARTRYEVIEELSDFSLVKISLLTGRTHQIRVHFSHIGHPLVADELYGGRIIAPSQLAPENPGIERTALHSSSLTITHPSSHKQITFAAPLAQDIENFLNSLR